MLLTFDKDGSVQFTRNPSALKLVEGIGKLSVTRMSEILFDEQEQKFYIKFLTGRFAGMVLPHQPFPWPPTPLQDELYALWNVFFTDHSPGVYVRMASWVPYVLMHSYEDAVKVEVAFIDFLREQGIAVQ